MERPSRSGPCAPAVASVLAGLAVLTLVGVVGSCMLEDGAALVLLGAPFLSGFATSFVRSERVGRAQLGRALAPALVVLAVASVGLVVAAEESAPVVLMALPPALVLSGLGVLMGHSTVAHGRPGLGPVVALMMCWPLLAAAEPEHPRPAPQEVLSKIVVDRPAGHISAELLDTPIGSPAEWYFLAGIARPQPAREFRLVELPHGRTQIEARTWYTLDIYPERYWRVWSNAIIHRIQLRVLKQVKRQAEASTPAHG